MTGATAIGRILLSICQVNHPVPICTGSSSTSRKIRNSVLSYRRSLRWSYGTPFVVAMSYLYSLAALTHISHLMKFLGSIRVSVETCDGKRFVCKIDSLSTVTEMRDRFQRTDFDTLDDIGAVVDVGAHVGIFSVYAACRYSSSVIISIEPSLPNYSLLLQNLRLNHATNVSPIRAAIAARDGPLLLWPSDSSLGGSTVHKSQYRPENVPGYCLDSLLEKLGIRSQLFIKIDSESAEYHVLTGASESLKRTSLVFAEIDRPQFIQTLELLARHSFHVRAVGGDDKHVYLSCKKRNTSLGNVATE